MHGADSVSNNTESYVRNNTASIVLQVSSIRDISYVRYVWFGSMATKPTFSVGSPGLPKGGGREKKTDLGSEN